ncbi:bifunctional indole-3-glycerol-phosphate synthase TrpC/phosphoribosylanthranilate isomerase TrpF [Candidatus Uhrbacteria bacterium]|nr:bifunctional indole-3-glycerol-phosphate synthase TrpC/phosphoribosylanthranilate isomerase TrpF [Candidatus Uhrbacteria bacterium]
MTLLSFLQKSIAGQITAQAQMEYLRTMPDLTAEELASVGRFLQTQMASTLRLPDAIDVCGTGGSGLPRINTSTIAAFILARMGVGVAKHGNRAASGRFGSFDLLESLGIEFSNDVVEIEKKYKKEHLAFLFAPLFHPVMKHFAEARKQVGKPTFFNLLGPLLNPANPKRQIIGTTFKDKMMLIARTCRLLGKEKVYVVCGHDGLDEITLTGLTFVTELSYGRIRSYTIHPKDFGVSVATFEQIQGGDASVNTQIAREIFDGTCTTRHRDLVLINVALALRLVDRVKTLEEGYRMALDATQMPSILRTIVDHKRREVEQRKQKQPLKHFINTIRPSTRSFAAAIGNKRLSVIAEVKRASPSAGMIGKGRFSPIAIAKQYERSGADAISVVCDQEFFKGSLRHLQAVARQTTRTPLLCKDFIIDEYQIYQARKHGADAILLIAALLSVQQINRFIAIAKRLNMAALCEVHTLEEINKVLKTPATIIGINNRDLHTFTIDLNTTAKLAQHIPADASIVSESGFASRADVDRARGTVDAVLVGTALISGKNIRDLTGTKLKICGVRSVQEARYCEQLGVDFIGLNVVPTSKRCVDEKTAQAICASVDEIATVGVFQDQSIAFVNRLARKLNLDYIQLSGDESLSFVKKCCRPVIKAISVNTKKDLTKAAKYLPHVAHILLDSPTPGSGNQIPVDLKNVPYPFLLAGGITPSTVGRVVRQSNPTGVDLASGVETNGRIDLEKVQKIVRKLKII